MRNFLTRTLVAVVGIPALLWIFHQGSYWLLGLLCIIAVTGSIEIWRASRLKGLPLSLWLSVALTVSIPLVVWQHGTQAWVVWVACAMVFSTLWVAWRRAPIPAALTVMIQLATTLWLGVGLAAIAALRTAEGGQGFLWLVFLFANLWIGDTAAYLGGVWIGGPKLSPVISPKKTIAGSIAQIIASLLIGVVYVMAEWIAAPALHLLTAAVMIAIVGQLGDLFESTLKRAAGIKDFSPILPGHGGVLDRFDSALFAAPALWIMIHLWPH